MSGLLMSHRDQGKDIVYVALPNCCSKDSFVAVSIYFMKILAKESKLLSLCPLQFHGFVGSAFH